MMKLSFVDCETTSLDPNGVAWEVAVIVYDPKTGREVERYLAMMPIPTYCHIDPISLDIGGFHRRHPKGNGTPAGGPGTVPRWLVAEKVARMTHGTILAGLNVGYDERVLQALCAEVDHSDPVTPITPTWHYSSLDLKSSAAAVIGLGENFKSSELGEKLGVRRPSDQERHTAMGDAEYAMRFYQKIFEEGFNG